MDKNQICYICNCSLPQKCPPSFTCNHTQCISCLANYLLLSEFKTLSMSEILFLCPCNNGKLSLMPSQLKELFSSSSEETTLCKKHKIAPECYCLDCKLWICSECKKTFHDDLFTSHKICKEEPKKEKECKVHQNEKIIKYCNECKKELCAQCEKEDEKHSSNIVDIKEKENEIKKEIKNKMIYKKNEEIEKIIEQKEKTYKSDIEKSESSIKEKATKIINEINKQVKDLESKKQTEIEYLDAMFSTIKFTYNNLYSALENENISINDLEELNKIEKHISEISVLPSDTKEMDNISSSLFKLLPSSLLKVNLSFRIEEQNNEEEHQEIAVESPAIEEKKETIQVKEEAPLLTQSQKVVQKLKAAKKEKIAKDKHITITTPHSEFLTSLVRISDDTIATAGTDKKVNFYLLNSDTGSYDIEPKMTISELSSTVRAMLVLSNGLSLVTGNSDGTLKLWSVVSKESIGMFDNYHTACVRKIIQLSDDLIASCSDDAHIKIWNINQLELTDVLKGEDTKIYDILLLDEGRLISCGEDCAINVWSIDKKGILKTLTEHEKAVVCLCKLSDGRFVSGGKDKCFKIWDSKSLTCKKSVNAHSDWVNVLYEVKKGILASGGRDNLVKLWDLETFECKRTIEWHCNTIVSIIKEEEDKIISASCDNTINIWNL